MSTKVLSSLGTYIREARVINGFSQERLAELTDLHPNSIGQIERDEKEPKWSTVLKLVKALGISLEDLYERQRVTSLEDDILLHDADIWVFKTIQKDRSFSGNDGYDDRLEEFYVFDITVPNHKNVKSGDFAIVTDKNNILGIALIDKIETQNTSKNRYRCPDCGNTQIERRKTKNPPYRCNRGHEFYERVKETIEIVQFVACYKDFYHCPVQSKSILKGFYENYNRNFSIQKLKSSFLKSEFAVIFQQLSYTVPSNFMKPKDRVEDSGVEATYEVNNIDEREKLLKQINERKGQQSFRNSLRRRYGDRCMFTGSSIVEVLEAAHICPYRGNKDNDVTNGLLLRSDVHTLFDLDLIGIHPDKLVIIINPHLLHSEYAHLHNSPLLVPNDKVIPSKDALKYRWELFCHK